MARKSTIGTSPLDAVVPMQRETKRAEPQAQPAKTRKERVTFQLSVDLIERVRDVVYWTPGATMSGFIEEALTAQLGRAEKNRGEPFPSRDGAQVKTGRPLKRA